MADSMTREQRHRCMSRIRGRDTKPELLVRKFLWRHGFRYRLYDKRLPGRPDIIMRKWRTVIFVNGCFWHGHDCEKFRLPKTNPEFWRNKIDTNRRRDRLNIQRLALLGFRVITIWECELGKDRRDRTLDSLLYTLSELVLQDSGAPSYLTHDAPAATPAATPAAAEPPVGYSTEPDPTL